MNNENQKQPDTDSNSATVVGYVVGSGKRRKAKKITIEPGLLTVEQFTEIVKNSKEPVVAQNEYGNREFYKTIMPYEIIDGKLVCTNWENKILQPPFLTTGQMFSLCDVEWEDANAQST